jgi:hypothetical protein
MKGWRTYACIVGSALVMGLKVLGYLPAPVADALLAALGLGGAAAMRAAISNP